MTGAEIAFGELMAGEVSQNNGVSSMSAPEAEVQHPQVREDVAVKSKRSV